MIPKHHEMEAGHVCPVMTYRSLIVAVSPTSLSILASGFVDFLSSSRQMPGYATALTLQLFCSS
jgi:hypothetical protein